MMEYISLTVLHSKKDSPSEYEVAELFELNLYEKSCSKKTDSK